ncbi:MAG: hypothetical protein ACRC7D_10190, partial [Aeromonas popoffii]|uniref:hypothetical protein n=1 Tax=Aeromonas popoffii TaxID=70856 RepID=UPI003F2F0C33
NAVYGGRVPPEIATMDDIIQCTGNYGAFAAVRANGTVVAWGYTPDGGTVPPTIATLTDLVQVTGTGSGVGAFAALRANGTVVAWGNAIYGGTVPAGVVQQLTGVRAVYCADKAFAALTTDSRVVTWGEATTGGNSSSAQPALEGQISYEATATSRGIGMQRRR